MRKAITITLAVALLLFLASIPAQSAEEDVACGTVWFDEHYSQIDYTVDEGANVSIVGHFMWLQYAHSPSSTHNIVSYDLKGQESPVTICTSYVAEGVIRNGYDDMKAGVDPPAEGYAKATPLADGRIAVASTFEPHPTIVDAWITSNGLVAM